MEESAEVAEKILMELFDIDEGNVSSAAKFGWYKPLVDRMIQGNQMNSFLVLLCLLFITSFIKYFICNVRTEKGAFLHYV